MRLKKIVNRWAREKWKKAGRPRLRAAQDELRVRRAEVCIVSFPKCGRTWLRAMIGRALCRAYGLPEADILNTDRLTRAAGLPVACFTHDGAEPKKLLRCDELKADKRKFRRKRVIFLARDPRDVLVSLYFHSTRRNALFDGTLSEFVRDDRFGIRKILRFYEHWHAARQTPRDFLLLSYEAMHADPKGALRQALAFMGARDVDDALIDDAVEFTRFEKMKAMERKRKFDDKILQPKKKKDPESYKVRQGKIGGHQEYLSDEDLTYIEAAMCESRQPFYAPERDPAAAPPEMAATWEER